MIGLRGIGALRRRGSKRADGGWMDWFRRGFRTSFCLLGFGGFFDALAFFDNIGLECIGLLHRCGIVVYSPGGHFSLHLNGHSVACIGSFGDLAEVPHILFILTKEKQHYRE